MLSYVLHHFFVSTHPIDGAGGILLLCCPFVCVCMRTCIHVEAFSTSSFSLLSLVHCPFSVNQFVVQKPPGHCMISLLVVCSRIHLSAIQ